MDPSELLERLAQTLEGLRIPYLITGSMATIAFREPRFTNDIDVGQAPQRYSRGTQGHRPRDRGGLHRAKTRELCPSCAAKRSAATAALLAEEVFEEVGHAQWVFVMPKMLRPYFLHHRGLLGGLAHAAWETVLELMCAAAGGEGMRPGMVAVVQTAGDLANWHPHVLAIVSRGGWTRDGEWIPVAFVDEHLAELLYRHKVMRLLQDEGLLSDERIGLLLSWRHTGFSVHNRVRVEPEDQPPQFVRRIAAYSNVSRGKRRKAEAENGEVGDTGVAPDSRAARAESRDARAMRRSWAQLMQDLR